jgi:aldehyde:ferredoxin oxidoreductase
MLDAYYKYRGWDQNGRPTAETLSRLGMDWLIDKM